MKNVSRARRRAWYANRSRRVRLHCERLTDEDLKKIDRSRLSRSWQTPTPYSEYYRGWIVAEGRNMKGGCRRSCWMCQPHGILKRDLWRQIAMQDEFDLYL